MMTAHTPAPWTVGKSHVANLDGFHVNAIPISGQGLAIASVWAGDAHRSLQLMRETGAANARLVKAAPDMLEALRQIATADYTRIDVATLGNIARAAIAAAVQS